MNYLITFLINYGFLYLFTSLDTNKCELIVKVENIKKIEGSIKIALYNHKDHFLLFSKSIKHSEQKVKYTNMEFLFRGLEAGSYAVSLFHDENDNKKLDTNFFGIPTEPYAFSNNAKGFFGPPSFDDCVITLSKSTKMILIHLNN